MIFRDRIGRAAVLSLFSLVAPRTNTLSPPPVIFLNSTSLLDFRSAFLFKSILIALALLLSAGPAFAQSTINVDATCSLAEAIGNANDDAQTNSDCEAGSGADTIVLRRKVELSDHAPSITGTLTINGRRHTIDGMTKYRPINIETTGADVTIHDITITRGSTASIAQGHKAGGAIRLTLPSSPDTQNASLTLTRVRIINNAGATNGGALSCSRANLTISDSVFANNSAAGSAGALSVSARCKLIIRRSAFHGNSAPNTGGAIVTHNAAQSILIVNSTFYNNSVTEPTYGAGGAIQLDGDVYSAPIKLHHLTVTGNNSPSRQYSGAGIRIQSHNSKVHVRNSIIWGNTGAEQCTTAAPHNLTFTNNIVEAHDDDNCGTASNANPRLPARPTGSVPYFALPDGSPAINAAPDCSALTTEDQRGYSRPYPEGGRCDAGAFEWRPPAQDEDDDDDDDDDEESGSRFRQRSAPIATIPPSTCLSLPAGIQVSGIARATQCRQLDESGIGSADVIGPGLVDAVDVYGWVLPNTQVCFAVPGGSFRFLDATTAPRTVSELPAYSANGMVCTTINRAGTVALLPGPPPPPPSPTPQPRQYLSGCMVRTNYMLNFRSGPDGEAIGIVPYNVTLTALERTSGWFKVDYHGARGWISAGHVEPIGNCG